MALVQNNLDTFTKKTKKGKGNVNISKKIRQLTISKEANPVPFPPPPPPHERSTQKTLLNLLSGRFYSMAD